MHQTGGGEANKQQRHWTEDERRKLAEAVALYNGTQWAKIAEHVGAGRSQFACRHRWVYIEQTGKADGPPITGLTAGECAAAGLTDEMVDDDSSSEPGAAVADADGAKRLVPATFWSTEECERLIEAVDRFGMDWRKIANHVCPASSRSKDSCRHRWHNKQTKLLREKFLLTTESPDVRAGLLNKHGADNSMDTDDDGSSDSSSSSSSSDDDDDGELDTGGIRRELAEDGSPRALSNDSRAKRRELKKRTTGRPAADMRWTGGPAADMKRTGGAAAAAAAAAARVGSAALEPPPVEGVFASLLDLAGSPRPAPKPAGLLAGEDTDEEDDDDADSEEGEESEEGEGGDDDDDSSDDDDDGAQSPHAGTTKSAGKAKADSWETPTTVLTGAGEQAEVAMDTDDRNMISPRVAALLPAARKSLAAAAAAAVLQEQEPPPYTGAAAGAAGAMAVAPMEEENTGLYTLASLLC